MTMKFFFYITFIFMIFFTSLGISQSISPEKIVDIKVKTNTAKLKKDGVVEANISLSIMRGWHINADKPLDNNLSPTVVKIMNNPDFKLISVKYPMPILKKLGFSDSDLALFENQATVILELNSLKKIKSGKIKIDGEVDYQPCNDQTCLFPVSKQFSIVVK